MALGQDTTGATHITIDKPTILYESPSHHSKAIDTIPANHFIKSLKYKEFFHTVDYNGKIGYLFMDDVEMDIVEYNNLNTQIDQARKKLDSIEYYYGKFMNSLEPNKVFVTIDVDTEDDFLDYNVNIRSTWKKQINYVTVFVQAYNPVDDKIETAKSLKCVGPINFNKKLDDVSSYTFENSLYTSIFSYARITKVIVDFKDKSQIIYKENDVKYSKKSLIHANNASKFLEE